MGERRFGAGALAVAVLCCGPALIGGLLSGVAVATAARATAVALLGLGVAGAAVVVARRRRCHHHDGRTAEPRRDHGVPPS